MREFRLVPATPEQVEEILRLLSSGAEGYVFTGEENFQVITGGQVFVIKGAKFFKARELGVEEIEERTRELAGKAFKEKIFKVYKKEEMSG